MPLAVLQAALWNSSSLSQQVLQRSTASFSFSSATKELGIGVTAREINKSVLHPEERTKTFYPVPSDSSHRLGDNTGIEGASMDELFDLGNLDKASPHTTEVNFFGLEQSHRPATAFLSPTSSSVDPETKWTAHPPFRFAVEFWDVDALKEKNRLHSHTVWYAGSLYNVYIQVVRKKGIQLGIYLHRQSAVDSLPSTSTPAGTGSPSVSSPKSPLDNSPVSPLSPIAFSASRSPLARITATTPASPVTPASTASSIFSLNSGRSTTLHSNNGSVGCIAVTSPVSLPTTTTPAVPSQPYRDLRPAVSAYFTIACASATGASLTRFTSAPDTFSVSQSWGWKSSSLWIEESDAEGPAAPVGKEVSLRATVVLGVV